MRNRLRVVVLFCVSAVGCGDCDDQETPSDAAVDGSRDAASDAAIDAGGPVCDNGVVEVGEWCDPPGSCPTSCDDTDACTDDTLTGLASECTASCSFALRTTCVNGDGCCPPGCTDADDNDCPPFVLAAEFQADYHLRDLGPVPGVPDEYGGVMTSPSDPSRIWVGGNANEAGAAFYEIEVTRNSDDHITGFVGTAVRIRDGDMNDGGLTLHESGVLLYTRYDSNEIGMQRYPASTSDDRVVALSPLGVTSSVGGMSFVPPGHLGESAPGTGQLKVVSWGGGEWYTLTFAEDSEGLLAITGASHGLTLPGGPEGIAYVPPGSPGFTKPSVLISEWTDNQVATYDVDENGDPVMGTRKDFIIGLTGAEGAVIDPSSGDFMFSTWGGGSRIVVVHGFEPPPTVI